MKACVRVYNGVRMTSRTKGSSELVWLVGQWNPSRENWSREKKRERAWGRSFRHRDNAYFDAGIKRALPLFFFPPSFVFSARLPPPPLSNRSCLTKKKKKIGVKNLAHVKRERLSFNSTRVPVAKVRGFSVTQFHASVPIVTSVDYYWSNLHHQFSLRYPLGNADRWIRI